MPLSSHCGFIGVQPTHTDQAQPKVADLDQQPVQGGLISHQPRDDRLAALALDLEVLEPGRPTAVEDPLDADLVPRRRSRAAHTRRPPCQSVWSSAFARRAWMSPGTASLIAATRAARSASTAWVWAGSIVQRASLSAAISLLLSVRVAVTQHARNDPLVGHHPKVHMPGGILRCGPGHEGAAGPAIWARQPPSGPSSHGGLSVAPLAEPVMAQGIAAFAWPPGHAPALNGPAD